MTNIIEYFVMGFFLCFVMLVGFIFARFSKNVNDYFRSNSQGTWWLVGMSIFTTSISTATFTASAGIAFEAGWSIVTIYIANIISYLLIIFLFAAKYRQCRATTFPEVINMRFGPITRQFYAIMGILPSVLASGVIMWALASFCSAVFGLPMRTMIVLIGFVVIFYATFGGNWAVLATDFVQACIILPVTILVAILCLHKVGGIGSFFSLIHERGLTSDFQMFKPVGQFPDHLYTVSWVLAFAVIQITNSCGLGNAVRFFSLKDGREARKAAVLVTILFIVTTAFWFIPPVTARLLYSDQVMATQINKPAEAAFAVASLQLLPKGLIGLLVVSMFFSTMGSLGIGLNRDSAITVCDIYPALCRVFKKKPREGKFLLVLGKAATVGFGAIIILLALYLSSQAHGSLFNTMFNFTALIGMPVAVPLLLAILVKRTPGWSCLFSIACAFAVSLISISGLVRWNFQEKTFLIFIIGCISFLITMPFWSKSSKEYRDKVELFFKKMNTPVDFEEEVGESKDLSQLRLLGTLVMAVGLFIMGLLFIPNPLIGRLGILFVAVFVLEIGSLLLVASWLYARQMNKVSSSLQSEKDESKGMQVSS